MSESAGAIPRGQEILAVWRQEAVAAADGRLLLIARRAVACAFEIGLWVVHTVASAQSVPSADMMAACADMPVQHMLDLLACKVEADAEFLRLLPGAPDAPPLDCSPDQLLVQMAEAWVLVTAYRVAREAYAKRDISTDQRVQATAAAQLDHHTQTYDRVVEDLLAGRRRTLERSRTLSRT